MVEIINDDKGQPLIIKNKIGRFEIVVQFNKVPEESGETLNNSSSMSTYFDDIEKKHIKQFMSSVTQIASAVKSDQDEINEKKK